MEHLPTLSIRSLLRASEGASPVTAREDDGGERIDVRPRPPSRCCGWLLDRRSEARRQDGDDVLHASRLAEARRAEIEQYRRPLVTG